MAQQRGRRSACASGLRRASMPRAQHWQTARSSLSQVRTSLAASLASFFLPRPGMRYWLAQGGVAGVGGLAEVVDGDVLQPVRQECREAALGGDDGDAAVAGGGLLGELGQGFLAGGAVDADAFAGVAGGEDVAGGFPAAVLALVDGAVAVGADPARTGGGGVGVGGGGHQAASSSWWWTRAVRA